MRARIRHGAYLFGVLVVGCALLGGRPAQAGPVQEQKKELSERERADWLRQRHLEEQRQAERRQAEEAAKTKHQEELAKKQREEAATQQQPHVPEIDGASIPTALALLGAGIVMLRARLRSK